MDSKGQSLSPLFLRSLLAQCDQHLEHAEPRVRSLVASTLGALTRAGDASSLGQGQGQGGEAAECTGLAAYAFFRERLSGAISTNFERTKETIRDAISGAENVAVDDTSGWKALETSLLALKVHFEVCLSRGGAFFAITSASEAFWWWGCGCCKYVRSQQFFSVCSDGGKRVDRHPHHRGPPNSLYAAPPPASTLRDIFRRSPLLVDCGVSFSFGCIVSWDANTYVHVPADHVSVFLLASSHRGQEFVDAIGRPFIDGGHLNEETVGYIVAGATVHINRHVREASFQIIR